MLIRIKDKEQEYLGRNRWGNQQWWKGVFCHRFRVDTIQQTSVPNNSQNQYIIQNWRNNKERELNMQTNVKTKNGKKLWLQALVNSGCTHIEIDKQLVKEEKIKIELISMLFEVFNADRTKNRQVTRFALLKVEIHRYTEKIDAVVTDLNGTDMLLGYDWLVKHNPEVNWKADIIWFTRCPKTCRIPHQDILFNRRI